jgi:hypothetical protein
MEQHLTAVPGAPVVCDMSTAPDTGEERMAEYERLFAAHLLGRERTAEGIRYRFRAGDGVQAWVQDLAEREHACCPFFTSHITRVGDEIHWDSSVVDDDMARAVHEEFYNLPETFAAQEGVAALEQRLSSKGFQVINP